MLRQAEPAGIRLILLLGPHICPFQGAPYEYQMTKRKYVIVGGGTTGWLLAFYLMRRFPKYYCPDVEVSLVESPDIATIGVGEGTFPALNDAFAALGLDDDEWMPQCDATYKTGIEFANWGREPRYFHPFQFMFRDKFGLYFNRDGQDVTPIDCSFAGKGQALEAFIDLSHYYCAEKTSKLTQVSYHFDAGKLADYLKRKSIDLGLNFYSDTITSVEKNTDGGIRSVDLRAGGSLEADFFFDCSGFHGLLIDKTLGVPFVDEKRSLLCDRALATRIPQPDRLKAQDKAHTTSTTGQAGWMWQIPLSGRDGCGYVYSSDFASYEQSLNEFQLFLKETYGVDVPETDIRQLRFRTGQRQRSWEKNCICFGLASSFIEPLEATAIGMTSLSIAHFLLALAEFDKGGELDALRNNYNEWSTGHYSDARDLIIAHYATASRNDTAFWQANKNELFIPASLEERLENWTDRRLLMNSSGVFRPPSWFSVLVGQSYR